VGVGIALPLLLAAAGTYCMIQGKLVDDISVLFYAGAAMLAIAVVCMIIACIYFAKHPPSPDSCFAALFTLQLCTSCCNLATNVAEANA
jgi:NADH:ubiquinone oxidoreductase subunit 6 (subunit J)